MKHRVVAYSNLAGNQRLICMRSAQFF